MKYNDGMPMINVNNEKINSLQLILSRLRVSGSERLCIFIVASNCQFKALMAKAHLAVSLRL
jgi:hypothetical protein